MLVRLEDLHEGVVVKAHEELPGILAHLLTVCDLLLRAKEDEEEWMSSSGPCPLAVCTEVFGSPPSNPDLSLSLVRYRTSNPPLNPPDPRQSQHDAPQDLGYLPHLPTSPSLQNHHLHAHPPHLLVLLRSLLLHSLCSQPSSNTLPPISLFLRLIIRDQPTPNPSATSPEQSARPRPRIFPSQRSSVQQPTHNFSVDARRRSDVAVRLGRRRRCGQDERGGSGGDEGGCVVLEFGDVE
jgi:hypothetical protein